MWCVVHNDSVSVNLVETFVVLKDNFEGVLLRKKISDFMRSIWRVSAELVGEWCGKVLCICG